MSIKLMGFVGFACLLICAVPQRRIRRLCLILFWGLGQLALLSTIVAGGFFYMLPEKAPEMVAARMVASDVWFHSHFSSWPDGLSWLLATTMLTFLSLPLLSIWDFAIRLATPASQPGQRKDSRRRRAQVNAAAIQSPGTSLHPTGGMMAADSKAGGRQTVVECLP